MFYIGFCFFICGGGGVFSSLLMILSRLGFCVLLSETVLLLSFVTGYLPLHCPSQHCPSVISQSENAALMREDFN